MYSLLVLLFVGLVASTAQIPLGKVYSIQGQQQTTINYSNGITFTILLDQAANVTLDAWTNAKNLPSGYNNLPAVLNFQAGLSLDIDNENANIISATLNSPPIPEPYFSLLVNGTFGDFSFIQVGTDSNSFDDLPVTFDKSAHTASVSIPEEGKFTYSLAIDGHSIPSFFNRTKVLSKGVTPFSFEGGFSLNISIRADTSIVVDQYAGNPYTNDSTNGTIIPIPDAFFGIHVPDQTDLNATLFFNYNQTILDALGVSANDLRFVTWDTVKKVWRFLQNGATIDTKLRRISQNTNHFSAWGVATVEKKSSSSDSNSAVVFAPCFLLLALVALLF